MEVETLITTARAARMRAYAPYSKFLVGAALLTEEGAIITGANIENASYGITICAERVALMTAIHAGHRRFKSIAVIAECSPPPTPCGACRQIMWELAGNIKVITGNLNHEARIIPLQELLPQPFGGEKWGDNPVSEKMINREEMWRVPLSFHPIGYVSNDYHKLESIPKNYKEQISRVIVAPEMEEGLYRLEEEKKIIIISYLHRAGSYVLKERRSGRDNQVYGVFSCRAPSRPNFIAQTTVDLVDRKKNILTVRGADLINGTPVLDIKTVLPDR